MTGALRRAGASGCATAIGCSIALLAVGCGSRREESSTPAPASRVVTDRASLPAVSLPDLSNISPSAQTQMRDAYAALQNRMQDPTASDGDLGAASGELGKLLMAAGYRDAAERALVNAQALARDDIRWPYYLGHLRYAKGDTANAAASFEHALQRRPEDVLSLIWLARTELDRGRPVEAEPRFQKALAAEPRSAAALLGLGQAALAKQDYARAVQLLEQASAIDAKAGAVQYSLGMAYRGVGDVVRAEAHLAQRNSIKVQLNDPLMEELDMLLETPIAFELRGKQALDRGEWAAAAADFRKGIGLAPDEPSLRHKLGTALAMSGDHAGAIQTFEYVVRRWPGFAKGQYSLGVILAASGRRQEAIDRFMTAVKSDPTDVQVLLQLAETLRASGRSEASLSYYERASEVDPRLAQARFGYVMSLVRLKRYDEARDHLDRAMNVFPDQPGFAHAAARLLAAAPDDRARDGRRALAIMKGLVADRPVSTALAETMAMALAEVGQYAEAVKWQHAAIDEARKSGFPDLVPRMEERLALYERGRPCRTPWGDEIAFITL
jgi:tetratricopeptide (TPR) repeat protein